MEFVTRIWHTKRHAEIVSFTSCLYGPHYLTRFEFQVRREIPRGGGNRSRSKPLSGQDPDLMMLGRFHHDQMTTEPGYPLYS